METLSQKLRLQVSEYCRRTGTKPSRWSKECFGHYEYGRRLMAGENFTSATFDRAQEYFRDNQCDPEELAAAARRSGA